MREENYETLYRSLYEKSRDAVIYLEDTTILDANNAAFDLFEVNPNELIGKDIQEFIGDQKQDHTKKALGEDSGVYTPEIKTKSDQKHIEITSIDVNLKDLSSFLVVRDITEITRLEHQYRAIFEKSADLIFITNESGVVFINPNGLKYLGLSSTDEIIGNSTINFIHPDYRNLATLYAALRRAGGNPPSQYRSKMIRKDGTVLDVEFNASYIDWEGVSSSLTIVRDIGEQVKLEDELKKNEAEKQGILNTIPDSITLRDLDYNLLWVNQTERESLKLSDEAIIGRKCYEVGFERDSPCDDCMVPSVLSDGVGQRYVKELPDGSFFDIIIEPVRDDTGEITSFLEMTRDITWQIHAEKEIRDSEARLSAFLDAATDGFSILDSDMRYLMVNDAELRFTGRKREDYLGRHILDVFPDLKNSNRYQGYLKVMETGETIEYRKALVLPERNLIVDFSAFKAGDVLGIVAKDVTEQINYQRRLEALHTHAQKISSAESRPQIAKETMDIIYDLLGFHIGSFGYIQEDKIIFTERREASVISERDLNSYGITVRAVLTGESQIVNDTSIDQEYFSGRSGEAESLSELDVPIKIDGQVVALINLESNQKNAFSEMDKNLVETLGAYVGSAINRVDYEHSLNALHTFALTINQYDSIGAIAQETLRIVDQVFNVPFSAFGVLENDAIWFPYTNHLIIPENHHLPLSGKGVCVKAIKEGQTQIIEDLSKVPDYVKVTLFKSETREKVNLRSSIVVPVFEHDQAVGVIDLMSTHTSNFSSEKLRLLELLGEHVSARLTALRFESERIRAEQAEEMQRIKTRFVSTATHELRTPLTSVKGYLELAQAEQDPVKIKTYLKVATRNANRLDLLTRDLLDQQRMEEGRLELSKVPVNFNQLINYVLEETSSLLNTKNQKMITEIPETQMTIIGDEIRLGQVLVNLIDNASNYSSKGSPIRLTVEDQHDRITVSVSDEGIGLNKEDISKLFKPFPDIARPIVSERSVGLGLSICKGFIDLHGGEIWAESEGRGKGSTFKFTLLKEG